MPCAAKASIEDVCERADELYARANIVAELHVHRDVVRLRERTEPVEVAGIRIRNRVQRTARGRIVSAAAVVARNAGQNGSASGRVDTRVRLRRAVPAAARELKRRRYGELIVLVVDDERRNIRHAVGGGPEPVPPGKMSYVGNCEFGSI